MSSNVASNRRIGVLVSYAYTACNILVQLIYVPLLLSSIGQEEYGLYQLIGSVVAYIISINGVLAAGVGFKEAYFVALVIMTPFTIDLIQNLGITVMQVMDKYHFRGYVYLLCALLNIPLTACLLRYGLIGAAASTAIASFIGNGLIMNWYYKVKLGLDIKGFWKSMAGVGFPIIVFTALYGTVYWLLSFAHQKWTFLLFGMIVYAIGYFAVLRIFVMNDYETALVDRLFRKKA